MRGSRTACRSQPNKPKVRGILFILLLAARSIGASAQPPPGYYDPAEGLTGAALKQALYAIIANQSVHTYAMLWTDFQSTDVRGDGKVWDIYSDVPGGTSPYSYTFVTNQCGTYNSEGDCYNREHSVPQSWFAGAFPMYTDLHHIYPVDGWVNNKRGELPYGVVGSADWTSQNGTRTGMSITPGYTNTVCEPIDAFKGDIARTYFYMMTRYQPNVSAWTSDMFQGDDLASWAEDMLVQWSDNDPVSAKETDRNNAIYAQQGNRNPFIDRPEWVHSIWGATAGVGDIPRSDTRIWWYAEGLHVIRASSGTGTMRVFDMTGRLLIDTSISNARADVQFDPTAGVYVVEVNDTSGSSTQRISVP